MSDDRIKMAASFGSFPEMETIEISADKENLIDYMWLFNNIPWGNHDGKNAKVIMKEPTELHYALMNGYDTKTIEIKEVVFDNVIIDAIHGFGGNSFAFQFKKGDEIICTIYDYEFLGFTREEVKNRVVEKFNRIIGGLKNQIKYKEEAIELVKKL